MAEDTDPSPQMARVSVEFVVAGAQVNADLHVPAGSARLDDLLPGLRALTDAIVGIAADTAEENGERISCKKGCGACCRQLVPISEPEARAIRDLVDRMPEPQRARVRARFAAARLRLQTSGTLDKLLRPDDFTNDALRTLGVEYFLEGIPCPFLEEESCSIHAERPLACREYLVTSPAERCSHPTQQVVRRVEMPVKVSVAVTRMGPASQSRFVRWVPLILAPEWAATHPDEAPARSGPELLREVFHQMAQRRGAAGEPPPFAGEPAEPAVQHNEGSSV